MVDWFDVRALPILAVEHGVRETEEWWEAIYTGPRTHDRLDYPAAEVLPNETSRTDAVNWSHSIYVNLYFERSRGYDYVDDILHPVADVLTHVLAALSEVEAVTNYHPAGIQDFAGELDNTSVLLVSIEFRAMTSVDPGEFDA